MTKVTKEQVKTIVLSFSLISILLFTNLTLLFSAQNAEAQRFVTHKFKVIPKFFTVDKTQTDIKDEITKTMPTLEQHVRDRVQKDFPNFKIDMVLKIFQTDDGQFEVYPKIVISGDTDQTDDVLFLEYDMAVDDILTTVDTDLTTFGITDITWKLQKSFGSIDIGLPFPKVEAVV